MIDHKTLLARARNKKAIAFDIHGVLMQRFEKNLTQPFALQRPVSEGCSDPGTIEHTMTWQEMFTLREELLYQHCLMCRDVDSCVLSRAEQRYPHSLHGVTTGEFTWHQLADHVRTIAHGRGYDQLTQEALVLICHPSANAAVVCPLPAGVTLLEEVVRLVGADRCYILSNISAATYEQYTACFPAVFAPFAAERVFISSHAGVLKPDPHIFEVFLEKYDLQPDDCLFIDDNKKNVASAQSVGLDAVLF